MLAVAVTWPALKKGAAFYLQHGRHARGRKALSVVKMPWRSGDGHDPLLCYGFNADAVRHGKMSGDR